MNKPTFSTVSNPSRAAAGLVLKNALMAEIGAEVDCSRRTPKLREQSTANWDGLGSCRPQTFVSWPD